MLAQSTRRRALWVALCVAALGGACESTEGGSPNGGDDDTDVNGEESAQTPPDNNGDGDNDDDTDGDDDTDDDSTTPPKGDTKDAGAKIDAKADEPSEPGDKKDAGRIDSGALIDSGSVVDPDDSDGAVATDDSSTPSDDPITLPASDQPGPYEVVVAENVGKGFENPPTSANDKGDGSGCKDFVMGFGESEEDAREYALFGPDYKVDLYTLYYPKNMVDGQLYPVLTWANGTCAKTNGYGVLLKHLASHGFIVVATNSRYTGSGKFQLRAVDFVFAENENAMSPLYKKVDKAKVGAFGHSQGGMSTWVAAKDARVKTSIILNMVTTGTRPTPTFYVTGDNDLFPVSSALSNARAQASSAALALHKIDPMPQYYGHITLMKEPERVYPSVNAWFRYQLLGDEEGKSWFVGSSCKLCNKPDEWEFVAKGLK